MRMLSGLNIGSLVEVESWEREAAGMKKRGETIPQVEYLPETYMPAASSKPFLQVGDRVRYLEHPPGAKFRFNDWPEGVFLGDKEVERDRYRISSPEPGGNSAWGVL